MLQMYNVPSSEMSCLFDRNAGVEKVPEPFRLQSNVCLQVALQEYQDYIVAADVGAVKLSAPVETLLPLAISGSQSLYRFFLRDVAFAIVKEIMFSEQYGKYATVILPTGQTAKQTEARDCAELAVYSRDMQRKLLQEFISEGFPYCEPSQERNKMLLNVATVLYRSSFSQKVPDVISLTYTV